MTIDKEGIYVSIISRYEQFWWTRRRKTRM